MQIIVAREATQPAVPGEALADNSRGFNIDQLSGLLSELETGLQADVAWRATNAFLRDAGCLA